MKRTALIATLLVSVVGATTTTTSAAPQSQAAELSATQLAGLRYNTFERPDRGTAYNLPQWSQDGWYAPWEEGMSTRSWIDGYNFHHTGGKSLRIFYPKGKIGPADSGAQAPLQLTPGGEYYLSFWTRF